MIEKIDNTLEKAATQGDHESDTISYLVKRRASLQKKHQAAKSSFIKAESRLQDDIDRKKYHIEEMKKDIENDEKIKQQTLEEYEERARENGDKQLKMVQYLPDGTCVEKFSFYDSGQGQAAQFQALSEATLNCAQASHSFKSALLRSKAESTFSNSAMDFSTIEKRKRRAHINLGLRANKWQRFNSNKNQEPQRTEYETV